MHVTASVRIVCVKMSNKCKQTALDLDQKIAIINDIEGGGAKPAAVAVAYGLSKQTVNSICMLLLCCLVA